jgi:quinoprotein glucose dehydrogenase
VRAFDVRTGRLRWAWDPIPPGAEVPEPAADDAPYRRSTANVWAIMSADAARDLIFLPTGNAPPDYYGSLRNGLDYFSNCVIALRASTGKLVWRFQTVHHDLWDYDLAAQPTLFDFPGPNGPVPALAQAAKSGHVFLLNRETGEPLFPVEERPVPQGAAAGDSVAPTQPFPTRPPTLIPPKMTPEDAYGFTFWDKGKCRDRIAQLRSEGIFTPPTVQGSIHYPSAAGGVNWGGGTWDPDRKLFIVNQSRVPSVVTLVPRAEYEKVKATIPTFTRSLPGTTSLYGEQAGAPFAVRRELLLSPWGAPCNAPPWGTLTAVDLSTGTVRWESALGTTRGMTPWPLWLKTGVPNIGGPITTATGLVFIAATTDNYIRAFDTETGKELWSSPMPFAGHATPLTFRLKKNGKQYVVIAAGGHVFSKKQGDAIIAYSL